MKQRELEIAINCLRLLAKSGDIPRHITSEPLDADTVIEDLRVDSVGTVSLLFEIEQEIGRKLPENRMSSIRTLGDLAAFVAKARSDSSST